MPDKKTGLLEGGNYKCGIHDFETADTEAWYAHCEDPNNGHIEDVEGKCIFCHTDTTAYGLPYKRPTGAPKGVVCDGCKVSVLGATPEAVAAANAKNAPASNEAIAPQLPDTAPDNTFGSNKKKGVNG